MSVSSTLLASVILLCIYSGNSGSWISLERVDIRWFSRIMIFMLEPARAVMIL